MTTAKHLQKSVEWYTPAMYMRYVHRVLGTIDLDVASCAQANRTVKATRYYTKAENGLLQPWAGRVWCNPPYCKRGGASNQEVWSCKLIAEYEAGHVDEALLLLNAATDTRWFHRLASQYAMCLVKGRIQFDNPDGLRHDTMVGSVFFYFGPNFALFDDVFSALGIVYPARVKRALTLFEDIA